jgi:cephalosporin hydroxylase
MKGIINTWNNFPTVDGIIVAQSFSALDNLKKIILNFDTIIEIGYNRGGLTHWFNLNANKNTKIIAYDISDEYRNSNFLFDNSIDFNVSDCFSEKAINKIKKEIETGGKVLFFCDGGDKNKEFNLFAQYLKYGDIIMLHDYHDENYEEKYAIHVEGWNSPYESSFNQIKNTIEIFNLSKYYYEDFRKSLIGSFIKN